jgi:hypothetical protein
MIPLTHDGLDPATLSDRKGDWMQTYTGGVMYPLDPRPEEIRFDDIVGPLSKMCRYNGQCIKFYSVAEHCVHVAERAPLGLQLDALMHDASEAYLSDVIRPIKPFLSNYAEIENGLMAAIAQRFGLQWPMPLEIKRLDNAILADELAQNMAAPPRDWRLTESALGVTLRFWTPAEAKYQFTTAFYRYGGRA